MGNTWNSKSSNAHPHSSEVVSVVHNGIIENSDKLREEYKKKVIHLNLKQIQRLLQ